MRRGSGWCVLLVLAALSLGCGTETADAPTGFGLVAGAAPGDRCFTMRAEGARSATELLARGLRAMSEWVGAPATPLAAWHDREDREANATFAVSASGGRIFQGVVLAQIGDGGGSVGLVLADAADAAERLPRLVRGLTGGGAPGGTSRPLPPMQRTMLPDGTGALSLPRGWRITSAHQGAVDCAGPRGARMSLGHAYPIYTPLGNSGLAKAAVVYPFVDPIQALREVPPRVADAMRRMDPSVPGVRVTRIHESARVTSAMGGQAAFVLYDVDVGGRAYRSLSLVDVAGHAMPQSWMFYSSAVTAPVEHFDAELPTMWAIWGSWNVAARVLRDRLKQAAASMRRTHELLTGANAYRREVFESAHLDWVEYVRGYSVIYNAQTNTFKELPNDQVQKYLEGQNRLAGFEKYRKISLAKLARMNAGG